MKQITEYILLPLAERQAHLRLSEPCVERGGLKNFASVMCRGLLAHFLDTTIPLHSKIFLCHACHNGECSNPFHLYWGTPMENYADARANGVKTTWENVVAKYGLAEAKRMNARAGNVNARGNRGKPKTIEHRRKTAEAVRKFYATS